MSSPTDNPVNAPPVITEAGECRDGTQSPSAFLFSAELPHRLAVLRGELTELAFTLDRDGERVAADVATHIAGRIANLCAVDEGLPGLPDNSVDSCAPLLATLADDQLPGAADPDFKLYPKFHHT